MPHLFRYPYFGVHGAAHGLLAGAADILTARIEKSGAGDFVGCKCRDRSRGIAMLDLSFCGMFLSIHPAMYLAISSLFFSSIISWPLP